jgi:hypothetical protein
MRIYVSKNPFLLLVAHIAQGLIILDIHVMYKYSMFVDVSPFISSFLLLCVVSVIHRQPCFWVKCWETVNRRRGFVVHMKIWSQFIDINVIDPFIDYFSWVIRNPGRQRCESPSHHVSVQNWIFSCLTGTNGCNVCWRFGFKSPNIYILYKYTNV